MMEPVACVPVLASGSVSFAPKGYHVMLEEPVQPLKVGGTLPLTLRFDDGSSATTHCAINPRRRWGSLRSECWRNGLMTARPDGRNRAGQLVLRPSGESSHLRRSAPQALIRHRGGACQRGSHAVFEEHNEQCSPARLYRWRIGAIPAQAG